MKLKIFCFLAVIAFSALPVAAAAQDKEDIFIGQTDTARYYLRYRGHNNAGYVNHAEDGTVTGVLISTDRTSQPIRYKVNCKTKKFILGYSDKGEWKTANQDSLAEATVKEMCYH